MILHAFTHILISILLFFPSPDGNKSDNSGRYIITPEGPAIDWSPHIKLHWDDFQARRKLSPGFGIASTYSDFEYEYSRFEGKVYIKIFVRFYCDKSWRNKWYSMDEVLAHEQLHFDINELFGRKFFEGIGDLKKQNKFSRSAVSKLYSRLQEDCNDYQDRYDDDTGHSTNGHQQNLWNNKLIDELKALQKFADYRLILVE